MAVTKQMLMDGARRPEHNANKAALDFGEKVLEISGLGDATYLPDSKPSFSPAAQNIRKWEFSCNMDKEHRRSLLTLLGQPGLWWPLM